MLLLDEPFGALDATVRAELREWLRRLHDEQGVTTVLVTHDQEEAMEVADRIAVMNAGTVEQVGSPREIYDRPATDFVMGFVGPGQPAGRAAGTSPRRDDLARAAPDASRRWSAGRAPRLRGAGRARAARRLRGQSPAHPGPGRASSSSTAATSSTSAPRRADRARTQPGPAAAPRPAQRVTQAPGSSASLSIAAGSLALAMSAIVTFSTTRRRFTRTAIHTRGSVLAAPA